MIGRIKGALLEKHAPLLLLDVNGIGYEIFAPMTTFYQLPDLGETITLFTHCVIREDGHSLYGFYQLQDRDIFRLLIKINGVGPKLALSILSGIEAPTLIQCVAEKDAARLTSIPGIGKKTGERLVMELKDPLSKWKNAHPALTPTEDQTKEDAISALTALGYKPQDAQRAIGRIKEAHLSSEELIRIALKEMVTK